MNTPEIGQYYNHTPYSLATCLKESLNRHTEVVYWGYRFLLYPIPSPGLEGFASFTVRQVKTPGAYLLPPLHNIRALNRKYKITKEKWARCEARYLVVNVLSRFVLPSTINKIVCFGLDNDIIGNPSLSGGWWMPREKREDEVRQLNEDNKWESSAFETNSQHLAAVSIKEYLETNLEKKVRLLTQNPAYTQDTMAIIRRQGFEIMGTSQIQGFLEVDENTVVISINPNTCVKEILADLARPAAFITAPYHEQDLLCYKMDWAGILMADDEDIFDPQPFFHNKLDYDTYRTKAMFKEYYKAGPMVKDEFHVLVGRAPRWTTNVHVYVRKDGSTPLFPEDFAEESNTTTEDSDSDEFEDMDEDETSDDENDDLNSRLSKLVDENLRSYAQTRRTVEAREKRERNMQPWMGGV
ncbi:hypothetical protein GGR58DRAFT_500765 [Xylaria digitata]|nr:hypothetical protein GGR58DRAFT_500765 [Xylaria digitata]